MVVSAWNALPSETIVNCFRKAGISAEILADFLETDNISDDELVDDSDDVDGDRWNALGKMSSYMHCSFSKSFLCMQLMVILFSPIVIS